MINCNCRDYIMRIDELDSTNSYLVNLCDNEKVEEYTTVLSDFQTKGRGQIGNRWESERGKNLTFSTVIFPYDIAARNQFIISIITSTAVCDALSRYTDDITIKWPNDIYWRDKKICGMLIENDLQGMNVSRAILGVGINVNQQKFYSDAPNPVSLCQIIGKEVQTDVLLEDILCRLKFGFERMKLHDMVYSDNIYSRYKSMLYRRDGKHCFCDDNGEFIASIDNVLLDGHLILKDNNGNLRKYMFKEVRFVLPKCTI